MKDLVLKETEIITELLKNLNDIKDILMGEECPKECSETTEIRCLLDAVKGNALNLDIAYGLSMKIKQIILGGNQ